MSKPSAKKRSKEGGNNVRFLCQRGADFSADADCLFGHSPAPTVCRGHVVGRFSLVAATLFVVLDAVDVAFTEAAVGAGISTILALATLSLVPANEKPHDFAFLPAFLAFATAAMLAVAVADLPAFGDVNAPIHNHVAPDYLQGSAEDIAIPNVVTSVLASYRGFDTLGETVVVFTAAIAVLLVLGGWTRRKQDGEDDNAR